MKIRKYNVWLTTSQGFQASGRIESTNADIGVDSKAWANEVFPDMYTTHARVQWGWELLPNDEIEDDDDE